MRVEKIEMIGFKSFADKTVFNFHPGITSIVGPNGCGKSNVVDAFKWVLGEQSAKSLRGASMEDVIFSGSATKKTRGMAEVTLVLADILKKPANGSEGNGREESTEFAVTRRLFKSGESEYLINKVPCRLKDIKNLFLDTGLELKAYSILEQGRIGEIVNSKPQDRRFLIEEVAGVMKYKVRKNEALGKLEASRANLQRLQDIITEVKRQIGTIDRHAKKAERYKKLYDEIKDIDTRTGKCDFLTLSADIAGLAGTEEGLKNREAEVSAGMHSTDALIEEKKRHCVEQEKSLHDIRSRLYALEKEVTEEEGRISLLKRDCQNLSERIILLARQDEELDSERSVASESLRQVESYEQEMSGEFANLEALLQEKSGVFAGHEEALRQLEAGLETERRNLFLKAEEISSLRNEINHINLNIENISRKSDRSSSDINMLRDSLSSLHSAVEEAREESRTCESRLAEMKVSRMRLSGLLKANRDELERSEEALYRDRESLAAMSSRLDSLREMDRSNQINLFNDEIRLICQVADVFDTPPEYEMAIEAVLGDKLRAAVVQCQDEITRALQVIRERSAERAGFIAIRPSAAAGDGDAVTAGSNVHDGVIGEALKFVSVKEGFEGVAAALLCNVILVDSLKSAMALHEQGQHLAVGVPYFVTPQGEVLEPSGIVFGGTEKGVLKIKRLIKELDQEILQMRSSISGHEEAVSAMKEKIAATEHDIVSLDGEISSQEKYSHGLNLKLENFQDEDERLRKKHEFISMEIDNDQQEIENFRGILQEKNSLAGEREEEKRLIEERISGMQRTISVKKTELEGIRAELTALRLDIASFREKMLSVRKEIVRLGDVIVHIDGKRAEILQEREAMGNRIKEKEQERIDRDTALKARIVAVGELQAEALRVNDILESRTAELVIIEKQAKELSAVLEQVRSELNHVEMKKMEKSMKLDYLREDMLKTYSVDVASAEIPDSVTQEELEKLPQLKEKLQAIGPVSLGTLEEFEELKTRYEFLSKQRDDLLQSIEALDDTIRKINRTTQQMLSDAFESLNEKFKEVFTRLFGKGRAELQLTEGTILDAGIEIIAQPPGKRLQNMMLLSGGEKALTALSLLFAGFMIKPTPLCILDEVDAPLDESNTERFIKLLLELSRDIQFITMTHNRRTMEAADYIYGVTMEEPGVSKVISMRMAEAAV